MVEWRSWDTAKHAKYTGIIRSTNYYLDCPAVANSCAHEPAGPFIGGLQRIAVKDGGSLLS